MSILIKGLEMPDSCALCPMRDAGNCLAATEAIICKYTKRPTDCPLANVPPHCRLIDADALKVSLAFAEKTAEWAVPALRAVLMVIDEMPTIITAEEGEA